MILTVHKRFEADDGHVDNTQMASSIWLVCVCLAHQSMWCTKCSACVILVCVECECLNRGVRQTQLTHVATNDW